MDRISLGIGEDHIQPTVLVDVDQPPPGITALGVDWRGARRQGKG